VIPRPGLLKMTDIKAPALLLVAILALAAACGAAENADGKTAATITRLGGSLTRDESRPGKPVVEVNFQASSTGRKITDADLVHLKDLKHVKVLYLGYVTDTTDAGLKHLESVTSLEKLALPETKITDAGLASLGKLTNLKSLALPFCKGVTDKGLAHLKGLKKLEQLNVSGTKVTKKGVAELRKALPDVYVTQ
jgi:internalin A